MKLEPNAPAFPNEGDNIAFGLTKREWMATMICAGISTAKPMENADLVAEWAVCGANALIAELNKEQ